VTPPAEITTEQRETARTWLNNLRVVHDTATRVVTVSWSDGDVECLAKWIAERDRAEATESRVAALREPVSRLLSMIYPEDVFTGESGDPGALAVVAIRKALADTAQAAVEYDRARRIEGAEAMDREWARTYTEALESGCEPHEAYDLANGLDPAAVIDAAFPGGTDAKPR